ncbi:MAG: histidinol-phosphatase HisJ family protein [Clostridia bacterium]|nr:histidinol-phosphatase HisJ family protein [Clostridia bacterium]
MIVDIHLHSTFSFDSDEDPENYVRKAAELDVPAIGFCEHYDYDAYLQGDDLGLLECDRYFDAVYALRRKYPGIKILAGVEFGYSRAAIEKYGEMEERYPFDYVVCSVHTLDGYGDFYNGRAFVGRPYKEAYTDYLAAVLESVESPVDSQIIAHIGYPERYCKEKNPGIVYSDYPSLLDKILLNVIHTGKCLEINTSAAGTGKDFFPDKTVTDRYVELGGRKFTFASDAHSAERYLDGQEKAKNLLLSYGIDKMYYFENKKEIEYPIL